MSAAFPNPLHELHQQAEAEFQNWEQIPIVQTFGQPQAEYAAIRKAAGLMDLPQRGVLELTGKDRLPFLNNLLTNQTFDKQGRTGLAPGKGVYAFLLDAKTGRIITDMNVIERGDRTLLEMDVRFVDRIRVTLEKYLFSEQVKMTSRVGEVHEISVHGPGAEAVLKELGMSGSEALKPHDSIEFQEQVWWRDDLCGVPGYFAIAPVLGVRKLWMEMMERFGQSTELGKRTLRPVGWAAFNTMRIEAGRTLFGIDFDETTLPHETGPLVAHAVSFTKGCYPGQEIVARMHARQQVARRISGFRMEGDALPIAGAQIMDGQSNTIGVVTSSTIAPMLSGAAIGLALLKKPHFEVGAKLKVPAEGSIRDAAVVPLPFVATK